MRRFSFIPLAIGWGALIGSAEGFWLLAPIILRTHHFLVETASQWLEVLTALLLLFVFIGGMLGLLIGTGMVALVAAAPRVSRDRVWLLACTIGGLMIPAYFASGAFIYFIRFRYLEPTNGRAALEVLPTACAIMMGLAILHQLTRARWSSVRTRLLAGAAVVACALGAVVLPIRFEATSPPTLTARRLAEAAGTGKRHPLLVFAIDGGNWRTIKPLLDAGRLTTLRKLIDDGIRGRVEAEWPPFWSTSAWGAIATGFSREDVNVYGDLVASVAGLPSFQPPLELKPEMIPVSAIEYAATHLGLMHVAPPPRTALKRPPVWELLERSGIRTAVVRFNFTYPADQQASIVISNRVVPDLWDALGVIDESGPIVSPVGRKRELLAPFSDSFTPDRNELLNILPATHYVRPDDALMDPAAVLRKVLPYDQRTFEAAARVLRSDPQLEAEIVHIGGFDNVCHAFWQYRFPGDYRKPPAAADVEALGPVIDRYLEFIDHDLSALISAVPETPNVVVISDHGEGATDVAAPWRGVHASPGIFLIAGPDVIKRSDTERVSYYDIVPTILDIEHLAKPDDMRGHSVLQLTDEGPQGQP